MLRKISKNRSQKKAQKIVVQTLPALEKGINIIEVKGKIPVFQLFIGNELLKGEECIWIDSEDFASTYEIARNGGKNILDQVKVSRSYTPFQHFKAVKKAEKHISEDTEILVMPSINLLYENGQLRDKEKEDLFQKVIDRIESYTEKYDLKLLASIKRPSNISYLIEGIRDQKIKVSETKLGLKFYSDDFESQIFSDKGGVQTTIPLYSEKSGINMVSKEVTAFGENEQDIPPALGKVLQ